jgi:hypothetical protein
MLTDLPPKSVGGNVQRTHSPFEDSAMRLVRSSFFVAWAFALAGLAPADLAAQPSLMPGGGSSRPSGDLGDVLDTGYHGRVGVHLGVPDFPVAIRAGAAYHRFEASASSGTVGGSMTQVDGTLSLVLSAGVAAIGPYFLGGIGRYRQEYSEEFARPDPETQRGWHGGVGFTFGLVGLAAWVEARFVSVNTVTGDAQYIPVSLGIRF